VLGRVWRGGRRPVGFSGLLDALIEVANVLVGRYLALD